MRAQGSLARSQHTTKPPASGLQDLEPIYRDGSGRSRAPASPNSMGDCSPEGPGEPSFALSSSLTVVIACAVTAAVVCALAAAISFFLRRRRRVPQGALHEQVTPRPPILYPHLIGDAHAYRWTQGQRPSVLAWHFMCPCVGGRDHEGSTRGVVISGTVDHARTCMPCRAARPHRARCCRARARQCRACCTRTCRHSAAVHVHPGPHRRQACGCSMHAVHAACRLCHGPAQPCGDHVRTREGEAMRSCGGGGAAVSAVGSMHVVSGVSCTCESRGVGHRHQSRS